MKSKATPFLSIIIKETTLATQNTSNNSAKKQQESKDNFWKMKGPHNSRVPHSCTIV